MTTKNTRWDFTDEFKREAVALALNSTPRKILGRKTPTETFDEHLQLAHMAVATTG